MAGGIERINYMSGLEGDGFEGEGELPCEVIEAGVEGEANDGATHAGVSDGGAVACSEVR